MTISKNNFHNIYVYFVLAAILLSSKIDLIMEKETYDEVITKVIEYLRERFSRKEKTLRRYQNSWRKVKSYMDSQNISEIDAFVCTNCIF